MRINWDVCTVRIRMILQAAQYWFIFWGVGGIFRKKAEGIGYTVYRKKSAYSENYTKPTNKYTW